MNVSGWWIILYVVVAAKALLAPAIAQSPEVQACENGDKEACWVIADRHSATDEQRKDRDEVAMAVSYLEKACELNHGLACNRLGNFYMVEVELIGRKRDNRTAAGFNHKACKLGTGYACMMRNYFRAKGDFRYPSKEKPNKVNESKCERGNPKACYNVADYWLGREPMDETASTAVPYLEKACQGSQAQACTEKSSGRYVDFSATVVFATCNSGVEELRRHRSNGEVGPGWLGHGRDALVESAGLDRAFLARWNGIYLMDELEPIHVAEVACLELAKHWSEYGIEVEYAEPSIILDAVSSNAEFKQYGVRQLGGYLRYVTEGAIIKARRRGLTKVRLGVTSEQELEVDVNN